MKKTLAILLSLALVICMIPATAFAETTPPNYNLSEAEITLSKAVYTYDGTAKTPKVTVKDGNTTLTQDVDYTVSYSSNTDAGTGTVTISGKGSATSEEGAATQYYGTATIKFTISKLSLEKVDIVVDKQIEGVTAANFKMDDIHCFYDSKDVTAIFNPQLKIGEVSDKKVTIMPADGNSNLDGEKSVTFETGIDIAKYYKIGYTTDNIEYTGEDLSSYVRIERKTGTENPEKALTSSDYKISFSRNPINAGSVTVTVEGRNNYAGTISDKFTIKKRDVVKAGSQISVSSIPTQIEGKYSEINPVIKDYLTDKTLVKGKDYYIETSGVHVVGNTGYINIIFDVSGGNYTGTLTKEFTVVKPEYDIASTSLYPYIGSNYLTNSTVHQTYPSYYNGSARSIGALVVYKDSTKTTKLDSGYYRIKYEYTDAKGVVQQETTLKDAHTYTIYLEGVYPYAGRRNIGSLTIQQVPFNDDYVKVSVSQSSSVTSPTVVVTSYWGDVTFVKGADYTVSTPNIYSGGNAYVTIRSTGTGNLAAGAKTVSYKVNGKNIAYCNASFANGRSSAAYTGSNITVDVEVRDGYTKLVKGTDYKVSYKNSLGQIVSGIRDAGTYTVIIEGIGAYSGSTTLTFIVTGTDISGYTVTLKEASVNATGYAQTPVITSVKKGYYYSLTANDYTVSYQDSTGKTVTSMSAPGTYKVVVTGKNGYSGSTYATFRIVGLPQTVTVTQDSYKVYATSDSFKITAKASGDATGFTYTSSNPAVASVSSTGYVTMHKVGRAVITVTATGMKKYDPASTTVEVKVYPKKGYITKKPWTDGKKYQAKVRWTYQDGATSYQVKYSRDKNFGAGTYKIKTVKAHGKDYTTQSTTLKSLKSKSTYYIKVRAVYKDPVTGDTYYGAWSGWRSVKTK